MKDSLDLIRTAFFFACERAESLEDKKMRPTLIALCGEPHEPPSVNVIVGDKLDVANYITTAMIADEDFADIVMCALQTYNELQTYYRRK